MKSNQSQSKAEQDIKRLDNYLSVQILLESILYSYTMENYEEMKKINPVIANLTKNDIYCLNRDHNNYMKKFRTITNTDLLDDFEELKRIIEKYLGMKEHEDNK